MLWIINLYFFFGVLLCNCNILLAQDQVSIFPNIALNASYTFEPPALYSFTHDLTDSTKLMDGQFATGLFWKDRNRTVGWQKSGLIQIEINLDKPGAIEQICINTAKGAKAGVFFPKRIDIFASSDFEHYVHLGNAMGNEGGSTGSYEVKRFCIKAPLVEANIINILISPFGKFTFIDEIEVCGNAASNSLRQNYPLSKRELKLVANDFNEKDHKNTVIINSAKQIGFTGSIIFDNNFAIDEEILFQINAQRLQRDFHSDLIFWSGNPWQKFHVFDAPPKESSNLSSISFDMIGGSTSSGVLNITNASKNEYRLKPQIVSNGELDLSLREAQSVYTSGNSFHADPLTPLEGKELKLRSGESKQLWLTAHAPYKPGVTNAQILFFASETHEELKSISVEAKTWNFFLPKHLSLNVNAWSYLNWRPIKNITEQAVSDLVDHHVNTFVLHPTELPWPNLKIAPKGIPVSYSKFDQAAQHLKSGKKQLFFLAFNDNNRRAFGDNVSFLSPRWKDIFRQWVTDWVKHLKREGYNYNEFAFYPIDEPRNDSDFLILFEIARLLKQIDSRINVYTTLGTLSGRELVKVSEFVDIFQVISSELSSDRVNYLKQLGKEIWSYSTDGGGKDADPYNFYRLQAWRAFKYSATGIGFWSYADTGSFGTAWNDFDGIRPDYSVIYEGNDTIISSKRWEAWREGIEDYELLVKAKKKLLLESEKKEFDRRVDRVITFPEDYDFFIETRKFFLNIASR